jgi:hypothetical protein
MCRRTTSTTSTTSTFALLCLLSCSGWALHLCSADSQPPTTYGPFEPQQLTLAFAGNDDFASASVTTGMTVSWLTFESTTHSVGR